MPTPIGATPGLLENIRLGQKCMQGQKTSYIYLQGNDNYIPYIRDKENNFITVTLGACTIKLFTAVFFAISS